MAEGNGYDRYPHLSGVSGSVVQVETLGRAGMVVMLVMFVVIVSIAGVAGYALGVGEARAENLIAQVRTLSARVEVIQWEFDKARGELVAKGIINDAHE